MSATAHSEVEGIFDLVLPARPYPGLRPFGKDEWPIFFGRERMTDEVIQRLLGQQFLVVHGDSGCGKSSLIRAGVLPRLEQEAARGGARWKTCAATPGDEPLKNLARALVDLEGDGADESLLVELRRMMNCGRDGAAALADYLRRRHDDAYVCILLDQFEETFAHARRKGPQEASLLIDLLVGLQRLATPNLTTVLTMRSEFLGACAQYENFAETVNATQYLLPRMAHSDLIRAVREPALLFDGEVSLDLAERLIADAGGGQDQLPLIQHGLMVLHLEKVSAASSAWRLTLSDYRADRGLAKLLSDHADQVASSVMPVDGDAGSASRIIEDLFRALTDINADGQAIRRPQKLSELVAVTGGDEAAVRRAIDAFRAEGVSFVRPYGVQPVGLDDPVDISHEALIRYWRRIAEPRDGWLIREFKNGLVWRSLLVQADSFERDHSNVLSSATTEERRTWLQRRNPAWSERYGGGWERVRRLIDASVAERDRQVREEAEERQREEEARLREHKLTEKTRRERIYRWAFVLVLMLLAVASSSLYWATREFRRANALASAAEDARVVAEQKRLAAENSAAEIKLQLERLQQAAAAAPENSDLKYEIDQAGKNIKQQVAILENVARLPAPRIYFHIADESQRVTATALVSRVEGQRIGDVAIVVPGIQLVKNAPPYGLLRCFRPEECKQDGERLLAILNAQISYPKLRLQEFRPSQETLQTIRPRHYELWFAPGPIEIAGKESKKY